MQTAELRSGVWASDPEHSTIRFSVPYLGIGRVTGVFRQHRASMAVAENGSIDRVEFEIEAASVDTNDETRDLVIRSMDFLDIESHPTIHYESTEIVVQGDGYAVEGRLRMNGLSHMVAVGATMSPPITTGDGTQYVGVAATGLVSRFAFGLRETTEPETRAQPDADLIRFTSELTFFHRGD